MMVVMASDVAVAAKEALPRDLVASMLDDAMEHEGPEGHAKYLVLRDAGEAAYPALSEILLESKDAATAGAVMAVFLQTEGDKRLPLQAMMKYLHLHVRENPVSGGVHFVLQALYKLGGKEEADGLRQFLDLEDPRAREAVQAAVDKITAREAAGGRRGKTPGDPAGTGSGGQPSNLSGSAGTRSFLSLPLVAAMALGAVILWLLSRRRHDLAGPRYLSSFLFKPRPPRPGKRL